MNELLEKHTLGNEYIEFSYEGVDKYSDIIELWVKYLLEDIETTSVQKIADLILNEAVDNSYGVTKDDMSLIVCKLILNKN